MAYPTVTMTDFEAGYFVGLLVGEGHFGGDQKQAQITLKMHVHHRVIFDWVVERLPSGELYGPYCHDGRQFYQWMARGPFLREQLVPFLDQFITPYLDQWVYDRYTNMKERYGIVGRGY